MGKGQEVLKKLLENDDIEAFSSKESLMKALKDNGVSDDDIESTLASVEDFPLDDEDLDKIAGGLGAAKPLLQMDITR